MHVRAQDVLSVMDTTLHAHSDAPLKYDTNLSYPACYSLRHLHIHAYASRLPRRHLHIHAHERRTLAVTLRHIRSASSHFLSVVSSIQKHRKTHTIKTANNLEIFLKVSFLNTLS
jgi:hypothetical protein